jgi:excinuclease ABC subunit C
VDEIDEKGYTELVEQAVLFLKGQSTQLLTHVKKEMLKSAQDRRFEQAINLRERYKALQNLLEDQKINTLRAENEDIFGIAAVNDTYNVTVLIKRDGKIIGKRDFTIRNSMDEKEVLEQFLDHFYYEENSDPPDTIVLPFEPEGITTLKSYLKDKYGRNINITVPQKGIKKRLMELARKNAFLRIKEAMYHYDPAEAVEVLKTVLNLDNDPKCIEGFDVATTLGDYSVASMVRFTNGVPNKRNYRKYRIKYTSGQNDVEMIKEAVARRYQRLLNEKKPMPDLVLVDGGVTQVNGALEVLDALDLAEIPVIGLAKKQEHIYAPWKKELVVLEKNNEALRLLMSIRNEAHRFANTYHVNIRDKETLTSKLKTIPGIGDALTNAIFSSFLYPGNDITLDRLAKIKGLGLTKAKEVYKLLQKSNTS